MHISHRWILILGILIQNYLVLQPIFSNLWTCFSSPHVWLLNSTYLELWTWIYLIWDVRYIDVCNPDPYIYFPNAKWAQVHMNLFSTLYVLTHIQIAQHVPPFHTTRNSLNCVYKLFNYLNYLFFIIYKFMKFVMENRKCIARNSLTIYGNKIWLLFTRIKLHFPLLQPGIHLIVSINIIIIYLLKFNWFNLCKTVVWAQ